MTRGAIIATDASTTPAGTVMVLAYERAPGQYNIKAASGVGTCQEGEAPTLLLSACQMALQKRIFCVVPDSEFVVGTPCTY